MRTSAAQGPLQSIRFTKTLSAKKMDARVNPRIKSGDAHDGAEAT
jgi:hypothetical protein